MEHMIKTWEPYWTDILEGRKTFEFRKNDRGYKVGDVLHLWRWPQNGIIPETFPVRVIYLVEDAPQFGLPEGYCIMGIHLVKKKRCRVCRVCPAWRPKQLIQPVVKLRRD